MSANEFCPSDGLSLCIVVNDEAHRSTFQQWCPDPSNIRHFSLPSLMTSRGQVTARIEEVIAMAATSDAVLIEWHILHAPLVSTLSNKLRVTSTPLIALCSEKDEDHDAAQAVGADDVLIAPFRYTRLRAQIMAHARSCQIVQNSGDSASTSSREIPVPAIHARARENASRRVMKQVGPLTLDLHAHRLFIGQTEIQVTKRHFAFISFLMDNVDRLITRDQFLEEVWELDFNPCSNVVEGNVNFVRRLLQKHGLSRSIETVRGKGYRFVEPIPLKRI